MPSERARVKLAELIHVKHGFAFKGEHFVDEPTPHVLVTPGNFAIGGGFQKTKLKFYRGPVPEDYVLQPGDLVVTMTDLSRAADTLGYAAVIPKDEQRTFLHNQRIGLVEVTQPGRAVGSWLHYLMRTSEYRAWVVGSATGSTVKHTSPSRICDYEFDLPDVPEQREVAATLDALDLRIDILRQTNATLESIGQTLFKSWFIDFDPVRAKAEGREPEGIDAETAALFPAEFEESELGAIPKGWRASTLEGLTVVGEGLIQTGPFGSQLHASDYSSEGIPVVMPQDLEGRRISTARIARVSGEHVERLSRHKLRPGDIVFSRRGDVGRHATVTPTEAGWLCGTGCLLVRPGEKWPSPVYVSLALATETSSDWLHRHAVGATMPNLNTGILGALPVLLPTESALLAFERAAGALEQRISENLTQIQTLASIRDAILPRLISGKLRLPEAEAQLNEAIA